MDGETILSYGGGRQTVAICVLIARGTLPKPGRIVMADTGRERAATWAYLAAHTRPLLTLMGLDVEVVPPKSTEPALWSSGDTLLIPAFTETGKLSSFCSSHWKRDRVNSYLSATGESGGEKWLGFALEEGRRIRRAVKSTDRCGWRLRFPLAELMLTTDGCLEIIADAGLPPPPVSSCWMCPNHRNDEWRALTPEEFAAACDLDDELRADDLFRGGSGVYLHHSRVPLREADLSVPEAGETVRQCGLGMCFV